MRTFIAAVQIVVLTLLALGGCKRNRAGSPGASGSAQSPAERPPLTLEVVFSSEKKAWAEEAIPRFNASHTTLSDGREVRVHVAYTGSVEPIADIVAGRNRAHVFSPASSLVIPLLNDAWTAARGPGSQPIATTGEQLVLSPVVIAMWRPMAEALGWPARRLGWSEIAALAQEPQGWRAHGHPEWGDFRFGHTHPSYSNSGLISVLAENYAAVSKVRDLTADDVASPGATAFVRNIESSVVHYGRSTGFFFDAMAQHGPGYLSAAVLYENLVVTAGSSPNAAAMPFPLVSLYPREGTMWADHPYLVLSAPWVTAAERDAAAKFRAFLLSRPIQERAMTGFGFRPANTDIALGAPIDAAHGADPHEPQTLLATPDGRTLAATLDGWRQTKRAVNVMLVFDRSGSMAGAPLEGARAGLTQFLGSLQSTDLAQLLTFSNDIDTPTSPSAPGTLVPRVRGVFAEGGTALYDAVDRARTLVESAARQDRSHIHAIVVLTDGEDRNSTLNLPTLLSRLATAESGSPVRIFTIGYGPEANEAVLRQIATRTGGAYYHGDVGNIRAVYDEIGSFF